MAAVIGALRADLSATVAQFEKDMGQAAKAVQTFGKQAEAVSRRLENAGRNMTLAITAPVIGLGVVFGRAAIAAEEMQSAFDVSFGAMADATRRWAETTGDELGRSTFALQEAALGFHGLFKAGGPATEQTAELARSFAVLAQDLSSFHDVSPEEAFERIRSGLSGEAEPLRRFNVYLTEATVQQRALALGLAKTTREISEQDKILARASLIMEATAEAQGDVLRTQDSAQNKIREAQANWHELSVTLGTRIIPMIGAVAEKLGDLIEKFGQLNPQMQDAILITAGVAATLGPLVWAAGAFAGAVSNLAGAWAAFSKIFTGAMAAAGITEVGVALRALGAFLGPWIGVIIAVAAAFWEFRGAFEESFGYLVTQFNSTVAPALQNLGAALMDLFGNLESLLTEGPIGELVRFVSWAVAELSALFLQGLGHAVMMAVGTIVDLLATAIRAVSDLVAIVGDLLSGDWAGAWEGAQKLVENVALGILGALDNIVPGVSSAAQSMFEGFNSWMGEQLAGLLDWIEGRFPGLVDAFSSAAQGAVAWARNMYQGIRTWIGDNLGPLIDWAKARIRELNSLFGWIRRRQAETSGRGGDSAPPAASGAPAAPPASPGAPPAAPPPPGGGGGGGRRSGTDRAAQNLERATDRMREGLADVQQGIDEAFDRRQLPRTMEAANRLREQIADLEAEAKEAGVSTAVFADEISTLQARIDELEAEGLVLEAEEFRRGVEAMADEVEGFAGDLGPLNERLRSIDTSYENLRQAILDEIEANRALADANEDAAATMAVLERQLVDLDAAHAKATASARALYEAEEHLADLQAARDSADAQGAITDLRRRRGEDMPLGRRMQEIRAIEEDLAQQRMSAAIELASLERDRVAALAAGDEAQAARLSGLIAQQTQLLDLVTQTTAEQIWAAEKLQRAFEDFVDSLSDELADMIMDWEFDLDGIRDVFKQLARQLFIQPVTDAFSAGIGSWLKGFAGGFATGGSLAPGQWGIVGENGPEPIYAGASRLNVISNDDAFGGRRGRGDVIFNVSTPNADSFRLSQRQLARRAKQTLGSDS